MLAAGATVFGAQLAHAWVRAGAVLAAAADLVCFKVVSTNLAMPRDFFPAIIAQFALSALCLRLWTGLCPMPDCGLANRASFLPRFGPSAARVDRRGAGRPLSPILPLARAVLL